MLGTFVQSRYYTAVSRDKIGGDFARPLQLVTFTPLDHLETQIISETISMSAILWREFTVALVVVRKAPVVRKAQLHRHSR